MRDGLPQVCNAWCGIFMTTINQNTNIPVCNDIFLLFCHSSIVFYFGAEAGFNSFYWFSIFAYGLLYFMIHDVLIHQRFKWFKIQNKVYLGLRKAHKVHKKHGKRG
jgi:hypothetical protein